jgi:predicted transcriptional regulator
MNALLKKAIAAVAALPDAEQQEVAEGLMDFVDLVRSGQPLLTSAQIAGVEDARREAENGLFATDAELAETWRKFGL